MPGGGAAARVTAIRYMSNRFCVSKYGCANTAVIKEVSMEVYDCIRSRRTVRNFKPEPVPNRILNRILRAGRWAPSSSNVQPWHFIVVKDPATLKTMGGIATQGTFLGQAPLAIAIVMENATRPQLDDGRALQQMELVAW